MKVTENPKYKQKPLDLRTPLVLGCGVSGKAAALFLRSLGGKVTIAEQSIPYVTQEASTWQQEGVALLHESALPPLTSFSLVVTSPGLPQDHPVFCAAKQHGLTVIGEMELALRFLYARAIGITGTNGKTSVTSLTHHVLRNYGIPCHAVGNIGFPLSQALHLLSPQAMHEDLFIIEMSSFQLEELQIPALEQGALLNLTPNHLNRHGNMESYARAKCAIAACMQPNGLLHVHPETLKQYAHLLHHSKIEPLLVHDNPTIENLATAFALSKAYGIDVTRFNQCAASWKPPAHRMAFVREKEGVRYYNDSKASNLAAVEKAVQCMPGPVLLLAGGVHKGASYRPWIQTFRGKVRHLFLFGQAALQIEEELGMFFPVTQTASLQEALHAAANAARCGEVVLLSPGCSSYDMFRDYTHRGESFEKWVREL